MAGVKQSWKAIVGSIRGGIVHKYEEAGTKSFPRVLVASAVSRVKMTLIVNEGRNEGRLIVVEMTPEEAEQRITELQNAIQQVRASDIPV